MDNKKVNVKKEYIRPNVIVRDVHIKGRLLGSSGQHVGEACESWSGNMNNVVGNGGGSLGDCHDFHNDFGVNNEIWGDDKTGAL